MACTITDPVGCLTSAASSVAGDAFSSIAHDFARAADSTIKWLWAEIGTSTSIHLGGGAFNLDLAIVATITGVVAVGLFVIQVVGSALRRDPGGLSRAFRGLVIAFIAGGAAVAITNLSLSAIDSLSAGVVQAAAGTNMSGMGSRVLSSGALLTVTNPAAMFLLSIATIAAVLIVWFALTVRKVLIVVSAVFAPLAFAGSLADITVSWTRRWIEVMAALIVSKLLLVIIFIVGWGVLDGGAGQNGVGSAQKMTQLVSGLLILGVAGLAPWMALKMIHFSGEQFHHLHGLAMAGTAGVQKAAAAPQKAAAWTSRIAAGPTGAASMGPNGAAPNVPSGTSGPVGASGATPGKGMALSPSGSGGAAGPGPWSQGQAARAAAPTVNPEASATGRATPAPPLASQTRWADPTRQEM